MLDPLLRDVGPVCEFTHDTMTNRLFFVLLFFAIVSNRQVNGQDVNADTALSARALSNAIEKFPQNQRGLFIGTAYYGVPFPVKRGHTFFSFDMPLKGDLYYNGVLYTNEEIQYDLRKDDVVIEHWAGQNIALVKEHLKWFTIEGHKFLYLSSTGLDAGFYELLAEKSGLQLFAKHVKKLKGDPKVTPYYVESTKYFLQKDGTYYRVKNASQLMNILSLKKKGSFGGLKKSRENEMIEVLNRYAP